MMNTIMPTRRMQKRFLINSLSDDLKKQLNQTVYKTDCFIVYWLELMKILRSITVEKYYRVMDQMKARTVSKYSGQNIELISSDWLNDFEELEGASMYDHNITMHVINRLLDCNGGEDF